MWCAKNTPSKAGSASGVVLFEVMIALGLFGLVAVGLVQALQATAEASRASRVEMHVVRNLQSLMTELSKMDSYDEVPEPTQPDAMGVVYSFEVEEMEIETEEGEVLNDMYRLRVVADWERHGEKDQMASETWRFLPLYRQQ